MGEWLWRAFGSVCVACVILKIAGGVWCLVELRRKWRAVPELWDVDWLDIVFRVESVFGVTLAAADFAEWSAEARAALTAGQLWELVAGKRRAAGHTVPDDGWEHMAAVLSEALNVRASRIARESRLYADLGMAYDLE